MAGIDVATLGIKVDANGAIATTKQLGDTLGTTTEQAKRLTDSTRAMTLKQMEAIKADQQRTAALKQQAVVTQEAAHQTDKLRETIEVLMAAFALEKVWEFNKEILLIGARYETLGVVIDVVGRNAGKTAAEMIEYQHALEKTGISATGARESLARMAGAQLDMGKASDLARVAQNAAVIANTNSTEAFERLIAGITMGQSRVLRTLGIYVQFDEAQQKFAKSIGKTYEGLTRLERIQANFNGVLESGVAISGTYEAAMKTAGKQIQSTVRYMENAKEKASLAFQPAFTTAVFAYANALKWAGEHANIVAGGIAAITTAVGGLTFALVGLKAASLGVTATPLGIAIAGAITVAAEGAYFLTKHMATAAEHAQDFDRAIRSAGQNALRASIKEVSDELAKAQDKAKSQGGFAGMDAKNMARIEELKTQLTELKGRFKENVLALFELSKGVEGATESMSALAVALQTEIDKTQEKIAFNRTHMDQLVQLEALKATEKAQNEAVTNTYLQQLAAIKALAFAKWDMARGGAPKPGVYAERPGAPSTAPIATTGYAGKVTYTPQAGSMEAAAKKFADWQVAYDAEQKKKMTAFAIEQATEEAEKKTRIEENRMRMLQETFSTFIENMLTKGLRSFDDFWKAILAGFTRMVANMLAADLAGRLTKAVAGAAITTTAATAGAQSAGSAAAGGGLIKGIGTAVMAHPYIAAVAAIGIGAAALWNHSKKAKEAAERMRAAQEAFAFTLDEYVRRARGTYTDLDAALAQAKANYEAIQKQIGEVFSGRKNETERFKARRAADEAYAIEIQRIKDRYDAEGKLKAAADATTKSMLNMVQGYKYQATIFAAAGARAFGGGGVPSTPYVPTTTSGGGGGGGGDLTIQVQMVDGTVIGNAVLKDFRGRAQRQFGDTSRWGEIQ
jgi:hypothetical protein